MSRTSKTTRRRFLQSAGSASLFAGVAAQVRPYAAAGSSPGPHRPRIGSIGMRYQGTVIGLKAAAHGDVVAVCDVDRHVLEQARASFGSTPAIYEDYRELLARDDIDVVTIGTPDHWHAKMLIDACRTGKDVYCEKPLTLTIDEGKVIRDVVRDTQRVVQVGSWQRSDERCRTAVEMVRQGRLGQLQRVDVVLNKNEAGGPFAATAPPPNLNWDLWQGQATSRPYVPERCHYTFRWWYEYAGGQLTDWGAHHLDIAQWAIGENPVAVESTATLPETPDGYNVPLRFNVTYRYPGGVVMNVADSGRIGILFTGSEGRIFVSRESLSGQPVEELAKRPLPREEFTLYEHDNLERPPRSGKLDAIVNHMGNFFDCVRSRKQPISDVESQHRSATTCHLGNISIRLGRSFQWNPEAEHFVNDPEADTHLRRKQRPGYEVA